MANHKRKYENVAEIIDVIVEGLSNGVPLRELCRRDGMPTWRTVYSWMEADEEIAARIAHARDVGADALAEEILDIIDAEPERVVQIDEGGNKTTSRIDSAAVAWAKNRADMRLKLLAKWRPAKYGDKQTVDVGNKDGEAFKIEQNTDTAATTLALARALRGETE